MAATVIVASHAKADELGVPPERRAYLHGWCYATDPVYLAEHPDLSASPAMAAASAAGARAARAIDIDDVAHLDLYSCFASSVHLACDALGIATARRPRPHRHRRPAVLRRRRLELPAPQPRRDGRRPPRRSRVRRPGHRRRHAHDQARLRRVLHRSSAPGRVRPPTRRSPARCRPTTDRRPPHRPRHGRVVHRGPRPRRQRRVGSRDRRPRRRHAAPTAASRTPICSPRWRPTSGSAAR